MLILEPGVYRQHRITPKDDQRFIGKDGAVLNGAMLLTGWQNDAGYWVNNTLPAPLRPKGKCSGDSDLCRHREDLFVDGDLYERVAALEALGPGQWFYREGTAYMADDPSGRTVELSVIPLAVGGHAKGVILKNLVVEKYASAAQRGAIDARGGKAWRVIDVTARWNHGIGIYIGDRMLVRGGSYSHNGQMGMGGKGDGAVIENVEIAHNNYAGFHKNWEAGGAKFVRSDGLIVRNSCVHHNDGNGLWTDIDNVNVLYDGNKIFSNARSGIVHEISYKATIRNNTVAHNGQNKDIWLWGSQILVQNSQDTEVYQNTVEVAPDFGNGIGLIYQDRGNGRFGPYFTSNNSVHHNQVILTGPKGINGIVTDFDRTKFWSEARNSFDWNTYVVPSADAKNWSFNDKRLRWSDIQAEGFEENGTLKVTSQYPMTLSCGDPG